MGMNPMYYVENIEEILYELFPAGTAAVTSGLYLILAVAALIMNILVIVGCWKVFSKAGQHGWATFIPIYRDIVFYRITWGSGWYVLLSLIPCAGWIINLISAHKLSKAFGHGFGYTLGLWFFPGIFYLILGLGNSRYRGVR